MMRRKKRIDINNKNGQNNNKSKHNNNQMEIIAFKKNMIQKIEGKRTVTHNI